jgi:hypothetical protein
LPKRWRKRERFSRRRELISTLLGQLAGFRFGIVSG